MKDQIEIGDLRGSHKIWRNVAIGAIIVACLMLGLASISPNPTACVVVAAVCLALSGGMSLLLRFMDHTLLLTPEGMCWISKARRKVTFWPQISTARVGKIIPTDMHPMLIVDDADGNRICGYGSGLLRFEMEEAADLINKMKETYEGSNKEMQATN